MSTLIVLAGKPGVGKSTLIDFAFPDTSRMDVLPFVKRYEVEGKVPEDKTAQAYDELYAEVRRALEERPLLILELGTNHEQKNITNLKDLINQHKVRLFLCSAPIDICRARALARERQMDASALERRLNKAFPGSYMSLLQNSQLDYQVLDMEKPLDENAALLKQSFPAEG